MVVINALQLPPAVFRETHCKVLAGNANSSLVLYRLFFLRLSLFLVPAGEDEYTVFSKHSECSTSLLWIG